MAIYISEATGDDGLPETTIKLSNGDRQLLHSVMQKWRFADGVGMLRFMLAIMSKSTNNTVHVVDESGKLSPFKPADNLLITTPNPVDGADDGNTAQQPPAATV